MTRAEFIQRLRLAGTITASPHRIEPWTCDDRNCLGWRVVTERRPWEKAKGERLAERDS